MQIRLVQIAPAARRGRIAADGALAAKQFGETWTAVEVWRVHGNCTESDRLTENVQRLR